MGGAANAEFVEVEGVAGGGPEEGAAGFEEVGEAVEDELGAELEGLPGVEALLVEEVVVESGELDGAGPGGGADGVGLADAEVDGEFASGGVDRD